MTFLPIVWRELRTAARRKSTFRTRTVVALGAMAVGLFLYLASDATAELTSQRIFAGLQVLSILFCLLAGRRSTADCLSEEKREGTLGLLFLTDLKGYDIVLGKLAATSLNGFYSLLAVLPVMAVPLLMGGITNGEFWRASLVLANSFVFSLAVGMFVSAFSLDARRAMGANLLLLVVIIGIPGALASALAFFLPTHHFYSQLLFSCPVYSLYLCDASNYRFHQADFWWSVGTVHLLTWLLLGLASWVVPRSWQERSREPGNRWAPAHNGLRSGGNSCRSEYRRRLLNVNAFYWLAARSRFKPLQVWAVLLFVAAWWVWANFQFGGLWLSDYSSGTNIATAVMLNVALKLWVGLEAGRQLADDRRSGAFELLLSTPLTLDDVLRGQWLALRRQFLLPVLFGLGVALMFMANSFRHSPDNHGLVLMGWLGAMLLFAADVTALVWTGMYCALIGHNPNHATVLAISRVIIAPTMVFAGLVVLANVSSVTAGTPGPPFTFYLTSWLVLGIVADLVYGISARHRLLTRFRQLASQEKRRRL